MDAGLVTLQERDLFVSFLKTASIGLRNKLRSWNGSEGSALTILKLLLGSVILEMQRLAYHKIPHE